MKMDRIEELAKKVDKSISLHRVLPPMKRSHKVINLYQRRIDGIWSGGVGRKSITVDNVCNWSPFNK